VHLAWRQNHADLKDLPFAMLADIKRELTSALGILGQERGRGDARDLHRRSRKALSASRP
jgi:alkyl hydroperoxide reductase subunit AhpC